MEGIAMILGKYTGRGPDGKPRFVYIWRVKP
jgi:hypothetical protein